MARLLFDQPNQCSCWPATVADWWSFAPENGAGLVTQFHESPPLAARPPAPVGRSSSIQTVVPVVVRIAGTEPAGGVVVVPPVVVPPVVVPPVLVVLLTFTETTFALAMLPAASRATAESVCVPLLSVVVPSVVLNGALVTS